jgi:hypothetical protein
MWPADAAWWPPCVNSLGLTLCSAANWCVRSSHFLVISNNIPAARNPRHASCRDCRPPAASSFPRRRCRARHGPKARACRPARPDARPARSDLQGTTAETNGRITFQQQLLCRKDAERTERDRASSRHRGRFGHADEFCLNRKHAIRLSASRNYRRSFVAHGSGGQRDDRKDPSQPCSHVMQKMRAKSLVELMKAAATMATTKTVSITCSIRRVPPLGPLNLQGIP